MEEKKKMYLINADDVEGFEPFVDDEKQISCIHLKKGGRIIEIVDDPAGRNALATNLRRAFNAAAADRKKKAN